MMDEHKLGNWKLKMTDSSKKQYLFKIDTQKHLNDL